MKFSIIIPVYNVEKYIEKCLESIYNQTYSKYEVIIINDGSPDNSEQLIKKYIKNKNNFKCYKKENGGLSDARNYGLQYVTGDYIIFVDSDDFLEKDLLKNINQKLKQKKYDIVRYGLKVVDEEGNEIKDVISISDENQTKEKAIKDILQNEFVEPAWLYAYNTKMWKKHSFLYPKGKIHEDYGLTPIILDKVKSIGFISYNGYNYVQRENSIMNQVNYEKIKKRCNDFKEQHINHCKNIITNNLVSKMILSFSTEALIYKTRELKGSDQVEMINFIKQEKLVSQLYVTNIKDFVKKIYLKLFLKQRIQKLSKNFYKN